MCFSQSAREGDEAACDRQPESGAQLYRRLQQQRSRRRGQQPTTNSQRQGKTGGMTCFLYLHLFKHILLNKIGS